MYYFDILSFYLFLKQMYSSCSAARLDVITFAAGFCNHSSLSINGKSF